MHPANPWCSRRTRETTTQLAVMISLGDLGKRAGRAENVAPMLKKVRLTVERSVYRQHASNRQHGSRLFASIHRVMPVSKRTCHFESESLISIAHFRKIMIAVCGSSKRTTSCGKPPRVFNTDQHYRPACAVSIWLRSRPRPLAVVEHSKTQRPQHSPPPALGPLSWCGLKNLCTEGSGVSNWREAWEATSAHNLAMLPVGCQFKNSSAKRGCALLGNPKGFVCIDSVLRKNG